MNGAEAKFEETPVVAHPVANGDVPHKLLNGIGANGRLWEAMVAEGEDDECRPCQASNAQSIASRHGDEPRIDRRGDVVHIAREPASIPSDFRRVLSVGSAVCHEAQEEQCEEERPCFHIPPSEPVNGTSKLSGASRAINGTVATWQRSLRTQ
jgi:hypothetical protein